MAQELWRRAAVRGDDMPEVMAYWQSRDHELDFVLDPGSFVEVKHDQATPIEFAWFARSFPQGHLTVVCQTRFETDQILGVTLEDFLLGHQGPAPQTGG